MKAPFKKITYAQYELFKTRFFKKNYQPDRFGQAFYKEFEVEGHEVDGLYFVLETHRAEEIILANYVDV